MQAKDSSTHAENRIRTHFVRWQFYLGLFAVFCPNNVKMDAMERRENFKERTIWRCMVMMPFYNRID